ncbi:hypothetical protein HNP40_002013 [Mycobacteroides chelonae]|nr:hypothetical protein [Mycobacteroides chelonae]
MDTDRLSSVVCFTMLHYVPTPLLPDRRRAAGFTDIDHQLDGGNQCWWAVKAA